MDYTFEWPGDGGSEELGILRCGEKLLGFLARRRGVGRTKLYGDKVLCFTKKPRSIMPGLIVLTFSEGLVNYFWPF